MALQVIRGSRKDSVSLIYEMFKYTKRKNRCSDSQISWVCSVKTCTVSLKTNISATQIIWSSKRNHDHLCLTEAEIEKLKLKVSFFCFTENLQKLPVLYFNHYFNYNIHPYIHV